ncbi:hypothetical protein [Blastococcus sp. PRF04-17]|uniref:hypothetical protein n=1 Tax=Blastococcus sp. PRF04-17 TaxID=2933797 RepID=UPI001FF58C4F|nr:hypothetical protein [Blastococcus sp. PRF04-17]UOY01323.1 hypothetical protein MVA48_20630 [Blastococcus sp. PRF04-17]
MVGDEATSMFAGQPQPVEIHHRGIWYSGELIGWRHESDGRVSARVRCRIDRLRHSAWVDLARLRLPDPAHPPRREPYPAPLPRAAANPAEADETRPHTMLAGLVTRAPKPAHATVPPPAVPGYEPAHEPPVQEPTPYESSPYGWARSDERPSVDPAVDDGDWLVGPRRSPRPRRNEQLRRHEAYLSVL